MTKLIKILIIINLFTVSCQNRVNTESKKQYSNSEEKHIDSTKKNQVNFDCYSCNLKLFKSDSTFIDTIFNLRNYLLNDSSKRINCNPNFFDSTIEKLIWECKYNQMELDYIQRLKTSKYAILTYTEINDSSVIARFYISNKNDTKTFNTKSFLITSNEIVGINILPHFHDQFTPIEEFDNPNLWEIDF